MATFVMLFLILISVVIPNKVCTHNKIQLDATLTRIIDVLEELVEIQNGEYLDPLRIPLKEN
jgi:hypothetical protein